MTIEELEKRQDELAAMWDELQAEINALKNAQAEEAKPKPPHPRWKPKDNELYYTNTGYGETCNWFYFSTGDDTRVIGRYSIGNIFRTEAEAEFAAERLKVLAEMREWAGNYNDGYSLIYDIDKKRVCYTPASERLVFGEMRFTTGADAEECIEAIGAERLMKYYFLIQEEDKSNDT